MMRTFLYFIGFSLLFIACNNSGANTNVGTVDTTGTTQTSLSEKIFAVADALPLTKDSASVFISGMFSPADSLKITKTETLDYYKGSGFSIALNVTDSIINNVFISPKSPEFPIRDLSVKMDSGWVFDSIQFRNRKEADPRVIGWYTDKHHKKKRFSVTGPEMGDSVIKNIWISASEYH